MDLSPKSRYVAGLGFPIMVGVFSGALLRVSILAFCVFIALAVAVGVAIWIWTRRKPHA